MVVVVLVVVVVVLLPQPLTSAARSGYNVDGEGGSVFSMVVLNPAGVEVGKACYTSSPLDNKLYVLLLALVLLVLLLLLVLLVLLLLLLLLLLVPLIISSLSAPSGTPSTTSRVGARLWTWTCRARAPRATSWP